MDEFKLRLAANRGGVAASHRLSLPIFLLVAVVVAAVSLGVVSSAPIPGGRRSSTVFAMHRPRIEEGRDFALQQNSALFFALRGGSDNVYEDEDEPDTEIPTAGKEPMDDGEEGKSVEEEEEEGEYEETGEVSLEEEEEEDYIQVDHEEAFEDEEVGSFVAEEVTYEEQVLMEESEEEDMDVSSDEVEENEGATLSPPATTQEALERATAVTSTDDENSSAFVDRMELADAYDLEDPGEENSVGADGAEAMAAVSAATAVGGGGSDSGSQVADAEPTKDDEETQAEVAVAEEAMIPNEVKDILLNELDFKPSDLKVLRPEIAAMLVENRLQKPYEGMPPNWYLPNTYSQTTDKMRKNLVKAATTAVGVAAVALVAAKGKDMGGIFDLDEIKELLQKIPAALAAIPASRESRQQNKAATKEVTSVPIMDPEEVEPQDDDEAEVEDHPHSVKPGATEIPAYEKNLDKTALDKFITKIENAIKAFFRIKI